MCLVRYHKAEMTKEEKEILGQIIIELNKLSACLQKLVTEKNREQFEAHGDYCCSQFNVISNWVNELNQ